MSLGVSPTAASTPTDVFNQRFEALFPCAGTLGLALCFAPPLFLQVYLHANVGPPGLPATALRDPPAAPCWPAAALPALLPVSAPPTILNEYFFFNSLVVGLPYSSIFWQFWLVNLNLLFSSFWLREEAKCVYLCLHFGWKFICGIFFFNTTHSLDVYSIIFFLDSHVCGQRNNPMFSKRPRE